MLVLYVLLAYSTVWGQRGVWHLIQLSHEQRLLERRVRTVLRDNAELQQRLWRLQHDDAFLEKIAREGLGLVRHGETVYRCRNRPVTASQP